MSLVRRLEPAALAAAGALQTLAFVEPARAWWLPVLAIAALVWRLDRADRARRALWLGWCFGTGWLVAGTWWLFVSMHRYGGLPAPLAAAAVLALAASLSVYLAFAAAAYRRWRRGQPWRDAALFAALWLLAELARGVIFTGFPWVASGYSQVDAPLAALAPWVGVYGIGALLAFAAALLAGALAGAGGAALADGVPMRRRRSAVAAAAAVAVLALPGTVGPGEHTTPAGRIGVTLLQTNIAQDEKFAFDRMPETLAWLAQALSEARGPLVVAPETAVPLLPAQLEDFVPGYWPALRAAFADGRRAALVGVPLGDAERGYTNSVAGFGAAADYRYDKWHLVPFGEFVPPGFRWFTEMMDIPLGDFARGLREPPPFVALGQRIAPNICYEDLFGEELARRFRDPSRAPTLLANVSNIGWFGDTVAVPQHLHISRMRALELQRPMVRATNTGATAIIDHRGRVAAMLPPFTRGMLDGQVEGREGLTPYARWASRFGLWPLLVAAVGIALVAARPVRARAAT
ncbi:MAG: apolipoprotein N-acyltransferase [Rubrivivax sp.]|nr:apolipoprotein N-acyltransferase [Rubrivivax sp.]